MLDKRWKPVRLPAKTFVVDYQLAAMLGLDDNEGLWPDGPMSDDEISRKFSDMAERNKST